MAEIKTKLAKDLMIGDKVYRRSDGAVLTIKAIERGMYVGGRLLEYTNGEWTNVLNLDEIEIA